MPIADYFSADYRDARERFCEAAERAGARLSRYQLPERRGPQGESLSIDVARVGPEGSAKALVLLSGTHGVEGLAGAGCQVGFLTDRLYEALPSSACALLVHALNPHGFAWLRRVNEDNVDLNRNFIDFSHPPPSTAYEPLHPWLVPRDWEGDVRVRADAALQQYIETHGMRAFQQALTAGQYTRPDGLFYGGIAPTWSAQTLGRLLRDQLPKGVRRVAVLDLHTGLGPTAYGEPILIPCVREDLARARAWFGCEVRSLVAEESLNTTSEESVSAELEGTLARGFQAALPQHEITFVGLEFGTRPVLEVLTALRTDHWVHAHAPGDAARTAAAQRLMRNAFYCETPAWQAAVCGRTADFVFRACRGLAQPAQ
jgi:predicted deacylase